MGTKLGRKELPSGPGPDDFKYVGRPATEQGDFGDDVGIVDCACVNQFGDSNNSKFYHGGVVQSTKTSAWFVYLQWGRITAGGESWGGGSFVRGMGDYQFYQANSEDDARAFFSKQLNSKNTKRLVQKDIGGLQSCRERRRRRRARIRFGKDGEGAGTVPGVHAARR